MLDLQLMNTFTVSSTYIRAIGPSNYSLPCLEYTWDGVGVFSNKFKEIILFFSLALYQRYIMSFLGKHMILVFKIDAYTRRKWPIHLVRTFHRRWRLFFSPSVPPIVANRPSTQLVPLARPSVTHHWHRHQNHSLRGWLAAKKTDARPIFSF